MSLDPKNLEAQLIADRAIAEQVYRETVCSLPDCERKFYSAGRCFEHFLAWISREKDN